MKDLDDLEADLMLIAKEVGALDDATTKVGYLPSSGDVEESQTDLFGSTSGLTKAALAFIQDQGSESANIPSRPFMQMAVDDNIEDINKVSSHLYGKVLDGTLSKDKALFQLGEWFAGVIKETIRTGNFEPLAEYTIEKKGSSRPLIDTSLNLLGGVGHQEQ